MRIAIATVGTTGDVLPFAALGVALRSAGHEVTAVSWELHRDAFRDASLPFEAVGPPTDWQAIRETARRAADANSPGQQVAVLRDFHLRDGVAHYRGLRQALSGFDVVVLHGIHSLGEAAARDLGARYATAVFDPVLLPTRERPPAGMPGLGPLNGVAWWLLDRMLARAARPLDELLRQAGSPSAGQVRLFRGRSRLLHLVACSPVLAGAPGDQPQSVSFTGAWIRPGPPAPLPAEVESFLAAGPAPAVVSFGSMAAPDPDALQLAVVTALRAAGLRAIIQAGAGGPRREAASDLLPAGTLDHRTLFPRSAVVVHHGGAGTSHAAAAAGVPSVVVPHVGDQPFWAERLHRLGAAPAPLAARGLKAEALAGRLREATTSPAIASAARSLAQMLRSDPGTSRAVEGLEALGLAHEDGAA